MNPLQSRLAALRRRLRWIVTVRGGCWALAVLLGSLALATQIDRSFYARWNRDLPALVRAFFLVCSVAGAGYVVYRFLLRPLRTRTDDLSLALRVEERYPILNDSLASTIEFLAQPEESPGVSKALRGEAIQRALRLAQGCDFNKAADTRGTRPALLALLLGCVLVLPLIFGDRTRAATSLTRFVDPFGGLRWAGAEPTTHLALDFPRRLTSNDEFVIQGKVSGVIPKTAEIEYEGLRQEGASERESIPIDQNNGELRTQKTLDTGREDFQFRFRVRAGKAKSPADGGWHVVAVRQAVQWAAFNDKAEPLLFGKASPQLELFYPKYTDLPSPDRLKDGSGDIRGIKEPHVPPGTFVKLRAAVTRPVLRVWIEHLPDGPEEKVKMVARQLVGILPSILGPRHPLEALALAAGGEAVWGRTYGTVKPGGKEFAVDFLAWSRGRYRIVLEREPGLTQSFEFKEDVVPDAPPTVRVESPSYAGTGSRVPLRVEALDERYAVRSVYLEYRRLGKGGRYRDTGPTRVPLYDHLGRGTGLPELLEALTGTAWPAPALGLRLRPRWLPLEYSWSLEGLAEEGEVLEAEVCADDFNDVSPSGVGRSGKFKLQLVGKGELRARFEEKRAEIEKDLTAVRDKQQQALQKVAEAEKHLREKGKLPPDQLREVEFAELLQRQIETEIDGPKDGLRAKVAKLRQELRDNNLQGDAADARLERVQEELAELSKGPLKEIPKRLRAAQDRLGDKQGKQSKSGPKEKGDLENAREQQQQVVRALDDLLKGREGWSDLQDMRTELRRILEEQRRLQKETEGLELDTRKNPSARDPGPEDPGDKKPGKAGKPKEPQLRLTPEQEAKRKELATRQEEVGRQLQKLLDRMKNVTEENDTAQGLGKLANDLERLRERVRDKKVDPAELKKARKELQRLQKESAKRARQLAGLKAPEARKALEQARQQLADAGKRLEANPGKELEKAEKLVREAQKEFRDRVPRDPSTLEKLEQAQKIAQENGFPDAVLDTARQLHDPDKKGRRPNLNRAVTDQEESVQVLERMVKALEEGRDSEVERLVDKQRGAKKDLDRLTENLEKLRKRIREAKKSGDAKELKQAHEEMKELQKEMEKKGRELARLRAEQAGEALDQAGAQLERAAKRMADGGDPDDDLKQAQKRVQDAQNKFKQAQERAEEELAREQMARLADQLKGLKVRQDAATAESLRLHKTLLEKGHWTDARLRSLSDMGDTQQGLGKETGSLEEKLKGAAVFELLLKTTAETMKRAGARIKDRTEKAVARPQPTGALLKEELAAEQKVQDQTVRLQQEASRRLQRLIEALKPEPNVAMRPKKKPEDKKGEPKPEDKKAKGGIPGENIPPLAQLKALRAEQQEVNDRTREFAKRHPDEAKLGPEERAELDGIRSNQQELHELFSKMAASVGGAPAGGGNP